MRLMEPEHYEKFKASGRLPSPKGVALAIIRLLRRADYKLSDLVQLLQSDPAIAGRLLKFANSAALANVRPIASVATAVQVLGAHRVRDLVLGFSILHDYRDGKCAEFDYETFWSHSLATAIAAQTLAKHAQIAAEESFTLGLLCDIGVLALAAYDCRLFGEVIRLSATRNEPVLATERSIFGTDHRALGAAVLNEWGLPETMVSAAFHSETPDDGETPDGSRRHKLMLTLHCARFLGEICVAGTPVHSDLLPQLCAKAARLGIEPDELTALADEVVRRWHEWGSSLRLHTHDLPPFAELLTSVSTSDGAEASVPRRNAIIIGIDAPSASELAARLAALSYSVDIVANGIDGLTAVLRDHPQLIVISVDSAELDGASFCKAFRANPLSHETHVMLLGRPDQEDRLIGAVEAGGDDYMLLPVSAAMLRVRLLTADKITHLREEIRRERRGLVRSASEWAGSHRRMMELALSDPLTHLPNRRYGLDFLAAEWAFAQSDARALACLMIDIDQFKLVNDKYGHDAGDVVLAGVAQIVAEHCRTEDMAFRYGGEEFCVVCTDTDLPTAQNVAERIRRCVELESYAIGEREIGVTISIGVAVVSSTQENADALVKDADRALYRAKANGRNRVEAQ